MFAFSNWEVTLLTSEAHQRDSPFSLQEISRTWRPRGRCCSRTPAVWQKATACWPPWKPRLRRLRTWTRPSSSWPESCWLATAWTPRTRPFETHLSWSWAAAPSPSMAPRPRIRGAIAELTDATAGKAWNTSGKTLEDGSSVWNISLPGHSLRTVNLAVSTQVLFIHISASAAHGLVEFAYENVLCTVQLRKPTLINHKAHRFC